MTDTEFATWRQKLFIAFPSLWEWLNEKSPNPDETQRFWRDCLRPYSLEECVAVVTAWSTGAIKRFEAYERDMVHLCVRAVIEKQRGDARKAHEQNELLNVRSCDGAMAAVVNDSNMGKAFEALDREYKRKLRGEITDAEYDVLKRGILDTVK